MQRAVVLVGVSSTGGGLPRLLAVESGVNLMAGWARAQGVREELIIRITDEASPVRAYAIADAVSDLVERRDLEQLIVYYSGHGWNIGYKEYWLLSKAPKQREEAVNLGGSADLARWCGIPHVVFISDACRTPAPGVVAQALTGTSIFPNEGPGSDAAAVDVFYASTLGRPAMEVKVADLEYTPVYTETVVDALFGSATDIVQLGENPHQGCIWPSPLNKYLKKAVPARLLELGVPRTTWQSPDAIVSAEGRWLSQLDLAKLPPSARSGDGWPEDVPPPPTTVEVYAEQLLNEVLTPDRGGPVRGDENLAERPVDPSVEAFQRDVLSGEQPPARDHFETSCGFTVEGRRVVDVWTARTEAEILSGGQFVRVTQAAGRSCDVLLGLDNGSLVVLPAVAEFIGGLQFDDEELVDVSYEPALYTPLRDAYEGRLRELRRLRSVIAAATRQGVFHLPDEESAEALARRMQVQKGFDPSLALYATYAYHDLGRSSRYRLIQMREALGYELRMVWFDLMMLSTGRGFPDAYETTAEIRVSPSYPALSQGWALATARQVGDQQLIAQLAPHRIPSPWTVFNAAARPLLRAAMTRTEDR
jgi:hypothetical protein